MSKLETLLQDVCNAHDTESFDSALKSLNTVLSAERERILRAKVQEHLDSVACRLNNWLAYHFERDDLLLFHMNSSPGFTEDMSRYDRELFTPSLLCSPLVDNIDDVRLDEVDVNISGGQTCILRFRLGDKWYRASVICQEEKP